MTDEEKQLIISYRVCFTDSHGERVLDNIKKISNFNNSVTARDNIGRYDSHEMARREGQRSVIVHIERMINREM